MKSCFRICVVISTVLVLGASHPQSYHQRPGYYSNQRWNQAQPKILPARQWSNYQQARGPEVANYQHFQKNPTQVNSHAPAVVTNVNEVPQEVVQANHTHRVRKISVPISELDKYKGARIIHLKDTGNPKHMKILRVVGNDDTVYEEKDIPDSLKDIIAKALANSGESATVHNDIINAQSINAQNENVASRPGGSLRPRNRFDPGSNERPSGYPFRRHRPFHNTHNHNFPVQRVMRPAQANNDNINVAVDDIEIRADKLENTKIVAINDVVESILSDEKPEVKSDPKITVTEPASVTTETDDDNVESESEKTSPNDDDDSFDFRNGRTLLSTTDYNDSDIASSATVTEPTIPTYFNEDDSLTATELRRYRNNNNDDSSKDSSTTAIERTTDINNVFINNERKYSGIIDGNSDISSTSKTAPSTFTKVPVAPVKSFGTINVFNTAMRPHLALNSSYSIEDIKSSRPYVIISPDEKEGTADTSLFTKLISYIIGKSKTNGAKIEAKDNTEFEEATDDTYLENDEDETETLKRNNKVYRMTSKTDTKVAKRSELKEKENKAEDTTTDGLKENAVITDDAAIDEKQTLTPISFITNLVRNALKGGDSIKELFSDQRVKNFILSLFQTQ